jgi:hypothetical protein
MDSLQVKLKNDTLNFLKDVNKDNFTKKYGGCIDIVIKYKDEGITKDEVMKIIIEIMDMNIDMYQEEILVEVGNRVEGFCSPGKEIKWD